MSIDYNGREFGAPTVEDRLGRVEHTLATLIVWLQRELGADNVDRLLKKLGA
jgi:hypothetical protein